MSNTIIQSSEKSNFIPGTSGINSSQA